MMKEKPRLSPAELQLMKYFWKGGEHSVREIQEALPTDLAYTTVQTLMGRLEEKGAIRRTRKIGNALMFEAAVSQQSVYGRMIDELLDFFGGSAEPLVAHLFEAGRITLDDLQKLEKAAGADSGRARTGKKRPR